MNQTYRVAVIGCGGRGREHVKGLMADPRVRIVGLADLNAEAAAKLRDDFGLDAPVYPDHQALLAAQAPEVVVTALITPLHLPVFAACAAAGARAVLCEKPMAPTWGACRQMAAIAQETGCQLTFSHQRRFAAGNLLARKMIADGLFGEIRRLDLYSPPNLLDCGTHTLDQAFSFLGETPVKWALGAVDTTKVLNWFNVRSEATAVGTLVYANGARAAVQCGGPDMDLWGGVRVMGEKGFLEVFWDGQYREGRIYARPKWRPETPEGTEQGHMEGMVRHVLDCLERGAEPDCAWPKALRAAEVIFALYESVRRRARVELPLEDIDDNPLHALLDADGAD
jgi:predicted dehydrogenase